MRLRVTDDDGANAVASRDVVVATTPPPPPPPPANLLANPSFETNLSGWSGYQATLPREAQAGAPAGAHVAKVTRSTGTSFTIDDGARAATATTAGDSYTAEAWVRAASATSIGKPIQIKLRERTAAGTVVADVGSPNVALSDAWQRVSLRRVATTTGGNLGVRVSQGGAVAGNAFYADAVVLGGGGEPPPPPVNQAPSASFSQTPASPVVGQQIQFADTSSDADGTIAARAWDLNNDGQFDDGTGTSAQISFAAAGTYTVRLRVTDDDGATAVASRDVVVATTPPPPPPPPANLLANPSFENNISGWGTYQATLAREAQTGAPAGAYVAKVTHSSGTSFTIDDGARAAPPPRPVTATPPRPG